MLRDEHRKEIFKKSIHINFMRHKGSHNISLGDHGDNNSK